MADAVKITGLEQVIQSMRDLSKRNKPLVNLVVGFSAPYALRVHEDLTMNHPRGGTAKFLEIPARQYQKQIIQLTTDLINAGVSTDKALETGGLFLLHKAQELVPVDTGFLRDSGYVQIT